MEHEKPLIWYVIPTYWTGDSEKKSVNIYDHPTPIGSNQSTLPRTLASISASFAELPLGKGPVLILISTEQKEVVTQTEKWVRQICEPFAKDLDLFFAGESVSDILVEESEKFVSDEGLFRNGYRGYGDVRNLQLIVPGLMGAEWIYAIDDDELVYATTINRILWHIKNQSKDGVAGIYLNDDGDFLVNASCDVEDVENVLLDKGIFMNRTFLNLKEMNESGELPVSPLALGGNMLFPRDMFLNVCFDPFVPRGEDIDFVINAKSKGFDFLFDMNLQILHLPPRHLESDEYGKMKADIIRFSYEKLKLQKYGLAPEMFFDYPGKLLTDEFEKDAFSALSDLESQERIELYGSPEEIFSEVGEYGEESFFIFKQFADDWPSRMESWCQNEGLIKRILSLIQ